MDCQEPPGWGRFAVPRTPRGYYRHWAQMQDAMQCARRTHIAFANYCRGQHIRGDNMQLTEWDALLHAANGGPFYAANGVFVNAAGRDMNTFAIQTATGVPWTVLRLEGWVTFETASSYPQPELWYYEAFGGNWHWHRSTDLALYIFPAVPLGTRVGLGAGIALETPDAWGQPWLNAI